MSGPAYFPMRHVEPKVFRLGFPREFCPVCAEKWMKQLWVGSCVCTGDVQLSGPMPGGAHVMSSGAAPVIEVAAEIVAPAAEKKPAVRKSTRKVAAKPKAADSGSLF